MMSTQRLIIVAVLLNLMVGLGIEIYNDTGITSQQEMNNTITQLEEIEGIAKSNDTEFGNVQGTGTTLAQENVGSALELGKIIWRILFKGLNPLDMTPWKYENNIESGIIWTMMLARGFVNLILIIELYMVLINKKQS